MRKPALDDFYLMRYLSSPDHHGPSGQLAYTISRPQPRNYKMEVFWQKTVKDTADQVTAGGQREEKPCFSPDGSQLLFLSDASEQSQIWICSLSDLSCRQITYLDCGVLNPVWSPDGSAIAFLSDNQLDTASADLQLPSSEAERKERLCQADPEPVVIEDYGYKSDDAMGFCVKKSRHLWVVSADGGPARRLTMGDRDHVMPVWSPDSGTLVFASNRSRTKQDSIGMDLFSMPAAGGAPTQLTKDLMIAYYPKPFQPLFTPDGKTLVIGALAPQQGIKGLPPTRLFAVPSSGGEVRSLWTEDAPCHEATCFLYNAENYGDLSDTARISEDGRAVYFLSGWDGACNIYQAEIDGEPAIKQLTDERACYRNLSIPYHGSMLAVRGHFHQTPQLCSIDLDTQKTDDLTDTNDWLTTRSLSTAEDLWVDTLDGKGRIHGFVMPPADIEEGRQYPAVLYIHGGPTPFYGYALTYEFQILSSAGFAVVFCNPRGSGGYGPEHGSMDQAFDGTAETDLLQFVDAAARNFSWIDPDRIGITGGSYGGLMTNWLAARTDRFRAAVTQRSIASNLISYASSDMAGSSKDFGDFTDFMKAEIRKSPVAYAGQINIPFLILHSTGDMRCPVEQAHQLYTAVKDTHPDLAVRMVLFPQSNHGLTMEGPMALRIRHYEETINWFDRYLKEDMTC